MRRTSWTMQESINDIRLFLEFLIKIYICKERGRVEVKRDVINNPISWRQFKFLWICLSYDGHFQALLLHPMTWYGEIGFPPFKKRLKARKVFGNIRWTTSRISKYHTTCYDKIDPFTHNWRFEVTEGMRGKENKSARTIRFFKLIHHRNCASIILPTGTSNYAW